MTKDYNKEEHEIPQSNVNIDLMNQLHEFNQDGFFCIDSIDYINRQIEEASERQKAAFIKRKNLEEAIQQKQELKNKLEKEIEDIDQKLVELRTKLGDEFESMQLEAQLGKY
ncbi:unnamed protein product [Schistosoma turkestanicum]|nr:unnamed protein product [Schistosoma turkestanicum]